MLELLKQRNLTNRGTWNSFIFLFQANLFEGVQIVGLDMPRLVDYAVSPFSKLVQPFVLVKS
jgi:hypothetical protein